MNPAILNVLDAYVGLTAQNIADLTGIALATVQTELANGLAGMDCVQIGSDWFLGAAHLNTPLYEGGGSGGALHTYTKSARWYAYTNRWYGPNTVYGVNYHQWSSNFGASGLPNWAATGIIAPAYCRVVKADMWFRCTDATHTYTARMVKQKKTDNSTAITNTIMGNDLVMTNLATNRMHFRSFDFSIDEEMDEGDVLVPLLTGSEAATRYLYFTLSVVLEEL